MRNRTLYPVLESHEMPNPDLCCVENLKFAAPIKDMLDVILPDSDWYSHKWKEFPSRFGPSPRVLAQTLGTDWGREMVGPDIWVEVMNERIGSRIEWHRAEARVGKLYGANPQIFIVGFAGRAGAGKDLAVEMAERASLPGVWLMISDVRFRNECELIHSWGGTVIEIERSEQTRKYQGAIERALDVFRGFRTHSSERIDFDADMFIDNNGTKGEYLSTIRAALNRVRPAVST